MSVAWFPRLWNSLFVSALEKTIKVTTPSIVPKGKPRQLIPAMTRMRMSRFLSRIQRPAKRVRPPTAHPTMIKHPTKPANVANKKRGGAEAARFVVQALSGMAAIRIKPARYRSAIETYNMVIAP